MYASFAILFATLTLGSVLGSRRDRRFLVVAFLGAIALLDALLWGIAWSLGGLNVSLMGLAAATVMMAAEAIGLPSPLARLTRLGIHDPDRDFDWRLWGLIRPFWTSLQAGVQAEGAARPGAREHLLRGGRRLLERLEALRPPNDEWRLVRDVYAEGVRAVLARLVSGASEAEQLQAFGEATAQTAASMAELRRRYMPRAPASPPWALFALVLILPIVQARALDLIDRAELLVPSPSVPAGWTPMPLPFDLGDAWGGNAVTDGRRLILVSREEIDGSWGATRAHASMDWGIAWADPGAASLTDVPETARPAIALAPDGSVWVALVRQGAQVATQMLQIGRSTDGGVTWPVLVRASPPSVGLVGLPVLLVTPQVHLVAFTDGETGAAMIQPLRTDLQPQGQPDGPPFVLGTTARQLYSNANFLDAGFALAATGRHVVALWHPSDGVINVSISEDAGRTWRPAQPLSSLAGWDRPHLIAMDRRFVALDVRSNASATRTWLELDTSSDGGQSWASGTPVSTGPAALEGVVDVSGGVWRLAYPACPGEFDCIAPARIWYRSSPDGQHWSDPQALSPPESSVGIVGVGWTNGHTWVMWTRDADNRAEDRVVEAFVTQ